MRRRGFTLVELLIVIVVIAILAAISIVAYSGIQNRAIDSRRSQDMASIQKALQAYNVIHGGVPSVSSYRASPINFGGWDVSSHGDWLSFLRGSHGSIPVDPQNRVVSAVDAGSPGNYVYRYHCYNPGASNGYPDSAGVVIGYRSTSDAYISIRFRVGSCLSSVP